uniref:Uncharacterized protein n=1 Tax=Arundo donax TaxID=35708 RepID=A0A0A9F6C3_ARUDO
MCGSKRNRGSRWFLPSLYHHFFFFPLQKVNLYPLTNCFASGVCVHFGWRSL